MRLRPSSGRDGSSCCAWQALNAALGPPPDISSRQCASAGYPRRRPAAVSLPTVVATNYEDATPVATNSAGDWPRILHAHKRGGGGGSRTPVRKALRSKAYTLIAFTYRFRQRPSGTRKNEPPASLIRSPGSRPGPSGGRSQASPLDDASLRPAGENGGDALP